jgi:isoleucyl-tRNA synthetase
MLDTIAEELNVKKITLFDPTQNTGMVKYSLKPVDTLGKELKGDFPPIRKLLVEGQETQVSEWARTLLRGESITVEANGKSFSLSPAQVLVSQTNAPGFAVAEERGYLAALSTTLTEELIREGLAREVVRYIQDMRKEADFELSDRIAVTFNAEGRIAEVMHQYADYIRSETLAESWQAGTPNNGDHVQSFEFKEEKTVLTLGVKRL